MDADALDEIIDAAITHPQQYTADGEVIQSRPILDLLEAQKIMQQRAAASTGAVGWNSIQITRAMPMGSRRCRSRSRWRDFIPDRC